MSCPGPRPGVVRLRPGPARLRRAGHANSRQSWAVTEASLIAQGQARRIVDCMAALEPDRARAVQGAYLGGLSYTDLSARFNVPLNTMRTWLRRSLLQLKECMEQ